MAAVDPGAYGPPPHEINNRLIEAVHHAIGAHPNPLRKASYGKMLAMLLGEQAREHQAHLQTSGSAGSSSAGGGQGAVADQGADGPAPTWANGHSSAEGPLPGMAFPPELGHPIDRVVPHEYPGGLVGQPVSPLVEAAAAAIAHGIREPVPQFGNGLGGPGGPMRPAGFSPLAEAAAHALAGGRLNGGYREQF